jgi:hypothetical protein
MAGLRTKDLYSALSERVKSSSNPFGTDTPGRTLLPFDKEPTPTPQVMLLAAN